MRQVILIPDLQSGGFTAQVPSLPGCFSEGESREESIINIRDAIDLFIEDMVANGEDIPDDFGPMTIVSV